ncbi:MAG: hypothetical protein A2X23_11655 [Chloroflexi bacterium GWC2_73_18]|nr:MAG: hypothetical protein A2X23_11655 [Chloroflexi bacterium GWC2_73_18]
MEYRDYYATLGVPRGAGQAEIKKAFRRLARKYHPDVAKGDVAAEQRFKEVNEANEVLGDPEKRRLYDRLGSDWEAYARAGAAGGGFPGGTAGFGGFPGGIRFEYRGDPADLGGFSEFFRTFFAGAPAGTATSGAGRTRRGAGPTFEEIVGDLGLGARGATGTAGTRAPRGDVEAIAEITLEEAYHGTSRIVEVADRRLEVTVPRGIEDGKRIRIRGKGTGRGVAAGDLYVVVRLAPHPVFARKGADLHRELPITLEEALIGAEVPVGTLKGRVLLTVPAGTQPGRTFRLAGQGMPRLRAEGFGDLYVKVRVVLPEIADEAGRELARRLGGHVRQPNPRCER